MAEENKSIKQRGQYDPGWNDPPMMQFNPKPHSSKTKLNLNKRIAFPISNTVKPTAVVQPSPAILPLTAIPTQLYQPPVAVVSPIQQSQSNPRHPTNRVPPLNTNVVSDIIQEELTDENEIRDFCLNTFQSHLGNIIETSNVRVDEIQRRLNILSQMWLNEELESSVHNKLLSIAKALKSKNFDDGIENHRILVVNHSNICKQWAPALRQIILTLKQDEKILNKTEIFAPIPSTSRSDPIPSTSRSCPYPSTSRFVPMPSTSRFEPMPSTSRFEPMPSTSRFEPMPSTSRFEPMPSTSRSDPVPSTSKDFGNILIPTTSTEETIDDSDSDTNTETPSLLTNERESGSESASNI